MKLQLRKEMTEKRNAMTEEDFLKWSNVICDTILKSSRYQGAKKVFSFVSMGREVNTYPFLEATLADGKVLCVPIAKKKDGMYFVAIKSLEELQKGAFGVMEPQIDKAFAVTPEDGDVFLVPGLVFDTKGNRYGYGGGFYDRYLQEYDTVEPMAVAFSFQVMETSLEVEEFDIPVGKIVTEKEVLEVDK
ncbi:5-formyltetrahydrofolate cyclo-ligase [Chakrabartyella piscis]|uniref:5-formyltetrahydrofolate cyclo-ligase n=1 Tax=Chakrabartyella piscis TaxID=2918914 RepID=UPI002958C000|nr:5-formyltetrahydrofolate cyclo-ligase [Chakrabartyella piscis]